MPQLPFDIPKSLNSYAEHFDDDPVKAISRLKKQLKKRGPDAVGHFLLAWFYHLKDMNEQAVDEALTARIYAPGSPFFQKLHYYLSHPKVFDAWMPGFSISSAKKFNSQSPQPEPVLKNLDSLISRLSAVESKRIRPPADMSEGTSLQEELTDNVDDIVSETLAKIHEKQGKIEDAIRTFKRLQKLDAKKNDYYKRQISRLEKNKQHQAEE